MAWEVICLDSAATSSGSLLLVLAIYLLTNFGSFFVEFFDAVENKLLGNLVKDLDCKMGAVDVVSGLTEGEIFLP